MKMKRCAKCGKVIRHKLCVIVIEAERAFTNNVFLKVWCYRKRTKNFYHTQCYNRTLQKRGA